MLKTNRYSQRFGSVTETSSFEMPQVTLTCQTCRKRSSFHGQQEDRTVCSKWIKGARLSHRDGVLQGGFVLAKSGRLEPGDNILWTL